MTRIDPIVEHAVREDEDASESSALTGCPVESPQEFKRRISNLAYVYGRMHDTARFRTRLVLLVTLSFSAISAGVNLFIGFLPEGHPMSWIPLLLTLISLVLVILSLASAIWNWDQHASNCEYAFRRLLSIKTKIRNASADDVRRLQHEYAEFGDNLPQTRDLTFNRLVEQAEEARARRRDMKNSIDAVTK